MIIIFTSGKRLNFLQMTVCVDFKGEVILKQFFSANWQIESISALVFNLTRY